MSDKIKMELTEEQIDAFINSNSGYILTSEETKTILENNILNSFQELTDEQRAWVIIFYVIFFGDTLKEESKDD